MTKEQIIDETVKYYSNDVKRRAVAPDGACVYFTEDNRMCAIGRCLNQKHPFIKEMKSFNIIGDCAELITELDRFDSEDVSEDGPYSTQLDKILRSKYKGHSFKFWQDIQKLHDLDTYWQEDSLSDYGTQFVKKLKTKHCS